MILLLKVTWLAEIATIVSLTVISLTQQGLELTIYRIRGEYASHYITIWVVTLLVKSNKILMLECPIPPQAWFEMLYDANTYFVDLGIQTLDRLT